MENKNDDIFLKMEMTFFDRTMQFYFEIYDEYLSTPKINFLKRRALKIAQRKAFDFCSFQRGIVNKLITSNKE